MLRLKIICLCQGILRMYLKEKNFVIFAEIFGRLKLAKHWDKIIIHCPIAEHHLKGP